MSGGVFGTVTATGLIYMNGTTDYVELYWYQNSGGSLQAVSGTTNTSFSGYLARSA